MYFFEDLFHYDSKLFSPSAIKTINFFRISPNGLYCFSFFRQAKKCSTDVYCLYLVVLVYGQNAQDRTSARSQIRVLLLRRRGGASHPKHDRRARVRARETDSHKLKEHDQRYECENPVMIDTDVQSERESRRSVLRCVKRARVETNNDFSAEELDGQ